MGRQAFLCVVREDLYYSYIENNMEKGVLGIYGIPLPEKRRRYSAISDALSVKEGDIIFFYVREEKIIKGPFLTASPVFYSTDPNSYDITFPLRFLVKPSREVGSIEYYEFLWSIDRGDLWSVRNPAAEARGTRKSMYKMTVEEAEVLNKMLDKKKQLNKDYKSPNIRREFSVEELFLREKPQSITEEYIQAWLIYYLSKRDQLVVQIFGEYKDYLFEVPLFASSPTTQMDVLSILNDKEIKIVELKRDVIYSRGMLTKKGIEALDELNKYIFYLSKKLESKGYRVIGGYILGKVHGDVYASSIKNHTRYHVDIISYTYASNENRVSFNLMKPR